MTIGLARPPDVLVSENGKLFAVKAELGGYRLSSRRAARLAGRDWLRLAGETESLPWPKEGKSEDGRLACDELGCIYRLHGQVVALVFDLGALAEDCGLASAVVSREPVCGKICQSAAVVIDRFDLWRRGGGGTCDLARREGRARPKRARKTRGTSLGAGSRKAKEELVLTVEADEFALDLNAVLAKNPRFVMFVRRL